MATLWFATFVCTETAKGVAPSEVTIVTTKTALIGPFCDWISAAVVWAKEMNWERAWSRSGRIARNPHGLLVAWMFDSMERTALLSAGTKMHEDGTLWSKLHRFESAMAPDYAPGDAPYDFDAPDDAPYDADAPGDVDAPDDAPDDDTSSIHEPVATDQPAKQRSRVMYTLPVVRKLSAPVTTEEAKEENASEDLQMFHSMFDSEDPPSEDPISSQAMAITGGVVLCTEEAPETTETDADADQVPAEVVAGFKKSCEVLTRKSNRKRKLKKSFGE